jgi:lysozyme|tara:strand:- start:8905 stop:9363 length:459 start_codon:yes stop_codon:yes gene_type:complete
MAKKKENQAVKLIKKWEGFMPAPYLCPAGVPTIGYGNTMYENGDRVAMEDCTVDRKRAEEILLNFVKKVEAQVLEVVDVKLKSYQLAALTSFTYNVGIGNLMKSTLLIKVNNCVEDQNIPDEFRRWNKSKGKVLAGLTARREDEAAIWLGEV